MELLVATLAYTKPDRDTDMLAQIRLISETVRNAPGLVNSRFYHSQSNNSYYFILTTWDEEESWRRAQERHNPRTLLLSAASGLLLMPPEQWLMRYLWGYSRPSAFPILAAAYLATIRPDQVDFTQKGWIKSLQNQATQSPLAFAFLARGMHVETLPNLESSFPAMAGGHDSIYQRGTIMLNLLSWATESKREEFFSSPHYQAIHRFVSSVGMVNLLPLEQM